MAYRGGIYRFLKDEKFLLISLFFAALSLRAISAIFANNVLAGDAADYSQLAVRIVEGKPFHSNFPLGFTAARTPLYPWFIAVIYFLTNRSVLAVKLAQAILGAFSCIVFFVVAKKLFNDKRISFGTGLGCAIYPPLITVSSTLISENLYIFLLALAIMYILKAYDKPKLKNYLLTGLTIGLLALTKPVILAFVPFLCLWLFLFSRENRLTNLKNLTIVLAMMALTIMPWTIRNYIVLKGFIPLSTGGSVTFYMFNNEETLAKISDPVMYVSKAPLSDKQKGEISLLSEPKKDQYLYRLGWKFAFENPTDFFKIRLISLNRFWHLWPETPESYKAYYLKEGANRNPFLDKFAGSYLLYFAKIIYHFIYDLFFVGMFVAFFRSFGTKEEFSKLFLPILFILSMSLLFLVAGSDRYRVPLDPLVFMLGLRGLFLFKIKR